SQLKELYAHDGITEVVSEDINSEATAVELYNDPFLRETVRIAMQHVIGDRGFVSFTGDYMRWGLKDGEYQLKGFDVKVVLKDNNKIEINMPDGTKQTVDVKSALNGQQFDGVLKQGLRVDEELTLSLNGRFAVGDIEDRLTFTGEMNYQTSKGQARVELGYDVSANRKFERIDITHQRVGSYQDSTTNLNADQGYSQQIVVTPTLTDESVAVNIYNPAKQKSTCYYISADLAREFGLYDKAVNGKRTRIGLNLLSQGSRTTGHQEAQAELSFNHVFGALQKENILDVVLFLQGYENGFLEDDFTGDKTKQLTGGFVVTKNMEGALKSVLGDRWGEVVGDGLVVSFNGQYAKDQADAKLNTVDGTTYKNDTAFSEIMISKVNRDEEGDKQAGGQLSVSNFLYTDQDNPRYVEGGEWIGTFSLFANANLKGVYDLFGFDTPEKQDAYQKLNMMRVKNSMPLGTYDLENDGWLKQISFGISAGYRFWKNEGIEDINKESLNSLVSMNTDLLEHKGKNLDAGIRLNAGIGDAGVWSAGIKAEVNYWIADGNTLNLSAGLNTGLGGWLSPFRVEAAVTTDLDGDKAGWALTYGGSMGLGFAKNAEMKHIGINMLAPLIGGGLIEFGEKSMMYGGVSKLWTVLPFLSFIVSREPGKQSGFEDGSIGTMKDVADEKLNYHQTLSRILGDGDLVEMQKLLDLEKELAGQGFSILYKGNEGYWQDKQKKEATSGSLMLFAKENLLAVKELRGVIVEDEADFTNRDFQNQEGYIDEPAEPVRRCYVDKFGMLHVGDMFVLEMNKDPKKALARIRKELTVQNKKKAGSIIICEQADVNKLDGLLKGVKASKKVKDTIAALTLQGIDIAIDEDEMKQIIASPKALKGFVAGLEGILKKVMQNDEMKSLRLVIADDFWGGFSANFDGSSSKGIIRIDAEGAQKIARDRAEIENYKRQGKEIKELIKAVVIEAENKGQEINKKIENLLPAQKKEREALLQSNIDLGKLISLLRKVNILAKVLEEKGLAVSFKEKDADTVRKLLKNGKALKKLYKTLSSQLEQKGMRVTNWKAGTTEVITHGDYLSEKLTRIYLGDSYQQGKALTPDQKAILEKEGVSEPRISMAEDLLGDAGMKEFLIYDGFGKGATGDTGCFKIDVDEFKKSTVDDIETAFQRVLREDIRSNDQLVIDNAVMTASLGVAKSLNKLQAYYLQAGEDKVFMEYYPAGDPVEDKNEGTITVRYFGIQRNSKDITKGVP
ncbi:MAG: hypothetical protein ABIH39_08775, partial [Candidatus Margulisiibacteriota bacterium]